MRNFALLTLLFVAGPVAAQTPEVELKPGLLLSKSCNIKPDTYRFEPVLDIQAGEPYRPLITIAGNDLVVDFQNAELRSTADPARPDLFVGLAIEVRGRNITIKNARVHGFKVALLAHDAPGLTVEDSDFSYNYRPRLRSTREREDFSDWLSYHQNDRNEWLRYGAGIYLDSCPNATVRACRITGNQNALLMTRCNDGLFFNNNFSFNSGIGIGLYRSNRNRVAHNRLDWNVRGYSHGFYQRGQDSAALLCYEQSNGNFFGFNSATHSGDGFFLWAGQSTMDTGTGGCNDNVVFGNNFSYAPTNGVEVTFSRNRIHGNLIRECTYGIWGGYSYESVFVGNFIVGCQTGIAIEHGQNDTIQLNYFEGDSTAIHLWARAEQPADWGYAQTRDTRSRDALIDRNVFLRVSTPLKISASQNIAVNGENLFSGFKTILETPTPNENLKFLRNDIYGSRAQIERVWAHPELAAYAKLNGSHNDQQPPNPYAPLNVLEGELVEPDSLPGGQNTELPTDLPAGRQNILIDEWGPYDFKRPQVFLANISETPDGTTTYTLQLLGPPGGWQIVQKEGIDATDQDGGSLPATITVRRASGAEVVWMELEYKGRRDFSDQFGRVVPAGTPHRFAFQRFEKKLDWKVQFFNLSDELSKIVQAWKKSPLPLSEELGQTPVVEKTVQDLYFAWWGSPAEGVQADHFATISTTTFDIAPGHYLLELTSDDGARLYVDGKRLIDHWDIHEPAVDEIEVELGGTHTIRIEHFEAGGFGTLDFRMRVIKR